MVVYLGKLLFQSFPPINNHFSTTQKTAPFTLKKHIVSTLIFTVFTGNLKVPESVLGGSRYTFQQSMSERLLACLAGGISLASECLFRARQERKTAHERLPATHLDNPFKYISRTTRSPSIGSKYTNKPRQFRRLYNTRL